MSLFEKIGKRSAIFFPEMHACIHRTISGIPSIFSPMKRFETYHGSTNHESKLFGMVDTGIFLVNMH